MTVDAATVEPTRSGPLADAGLLDFASVYDTLYRSSGGRCLPTDADAMELWQIAVLLGLSDEVRAPTEPGDAKEQRTRSRDLLRQRMAHARGQGPKPEARPVDPVAFNQLANMKV